MTSSSRWGSESEESAWISMVDLLVVLLCIGVIVLVIQASQQRLARAKSTEQEQTIGDARENLARLQKESGDWKIVAERSTADLSRLKRQISDAAQRIGVPAEGVEPLINQALTAQETKVQLDRALTERAQALKEWAEAEARAAELHRKSESANETLAQTMKDNDELRSKLRTALDALELETRDARKALEAAAEAEARSSRDAQDATARAEARAREAESLERALERERGVAQRQSAEAGRIKQELLGLPGSVEKVVFVVDRSQSMERGGRWDDARRTIEAWIRHLPVSHVALVVFGSDVEVIPKLAGSGIQGGEDTLELPPATGELRLKMESELARLKPSGQTQTAMGLRRAMQFKSIDAIVLFTDGAPDAADPLTPGDPRAEVVALATRWKQQHPAARIHTVGIGDYFNPHMRDFLLGVAKATDGAFIGR